MSNIDPSAGYELRSEERDGYLYVSVDSEAITYDIAGNYWKEIIQLCHSSRSRRLLLHKRIRLDLSLADLYQLASSIAAELSGYRIAIFDEFTSTHMLEFGELVSSNRGLDMKTFKDLEEAKAWLLKS